MKLNNTQRDIIKGLQVDQKTLEIFNKYNDIIGEDIKKLVISAENKPITTQNNYGNYLSVITSLINSGINKSLVGLLLVFHGGNKLGISSCVKILQNK